MADPYRVLLQILRLNHLRDAEKLVRCMRHGKSKDLEVLLHANLESLAAQGIFFDRDMHAIISSIVELCPDPKPLGEASVKEG